MSLKWNFVVGVAFTTVCLLMIKLYFDSQRAPDLEVNQMPRQATEDDIYAVTARLIHQRNNISRMLNLKQQIIGQMQCEQQAKKRIATSNTGGWCQQSSNESYGHHMTDKSLADALAEFFSGKFVGSFGDGPGRYKEHLLNSGKIKGYDAFDGAPFSERTSEGRVQYLDLTLPQYGLKMYDWIISLEVAEHIPREYEAVYIDNIVRHAREGVVLSWAVPGQEGYSHVNNRPFEYVRDLFKGLGFEHDDAASAKLKEAGKLPWIRKNTNVYRRKDFSNIDKMETLYV